MKKLVICPSVSAGRAVLVLVVVSLLLLSAAPVSSAPAAGTTPALPPSSPGEPFLAEGRLPQRWEGCVLQPTVGAVAGSAVNFAMVGTIDLLALIMLMPLFILPGSGSEDMLYTTSYYTLLGSTILLHPLFATLGVLGYGQAVGLEGSGLLSVLLAYAGAGAGVALYYAGLPATGAATMLLAPPLGAMIGYRVTERDGVSASRQFSGRWIGSRSPVWQRTTRRAILDTLGGLGAGLSWLFGRWQTLVLAEPTGEFDNSREWILDGTVVDQLAFVPLSASCGVTAADHLTGHGGSLVWSVAGGIAGSVVGWGIAELFGTYSAVVSVICGTAGATAATILTDPLR